MRGGQFDPKTIQARISNLNRIEECYEEDLDVIYEKDQFAALLQTLAYSMKDKYTNEPNPSRIEIKGDIYSGLATIRTAVNLYKRFRDEFVPGQDNDSEEAPEDTEDLTFPLERDLQAALRKSIDQLEGGLTIIDDGAEYAVPSGRIDILARDQSGTQVVIELKAIRATREAVGQILSYMGDIYKHGESKVRGILVAPAFDARALSAARMVDGLRLVTYGYKFSFTQQVAAERQSGPNAVPSSGGAGVKEVSF